MEFQVLGPLRALDGGRAVDLGWPKQRAVLAALLLSPNRPVSVSELIAAAWDDPPDSAVGAVQKYVSGLRGRLGADRLRTRPPGYLVVVDHEELDLLRFDELVAGGREAAKGGEVRAAVTQWRSALELWRGELAEDVRFGENWQPKRRALAERRAAVRAELIDARLVLGEHEQLIPELRELVAAEPTAERHWAQLMRALRAAGRSAEGLTAFARAREALAEQLGVEPGAELRGLHAELLTDQSAPSTDPGWQVQRQLPIDVSDFVGRARLCRVLLERVVSGGTAGRPPVLVVSGAPGVGKTALAVRVAHLAQERFPDGQWFVRLDGAGPRPREPGAVLAELLYACGVPSQSIPPGTAARAAALRARLAGRRVLLVLDDAAEADQVRPLLPGSAGCAALATSRSQLRGLAALEGARTFALDPLRAEESAALIAAILGAPLAGEQPQALAELADLCGHLPLALRIAAANVAGRPRPSLGEYVDELRQGNRLGQLAVANDRQAAVLVAFESAYTGLEPELRRLFRAFGVLPGGDLTVPAAAALLGSEPEVAATLLARLAATNLAQERARGRYGLHDLLRLYAADRSQRDDDQDTREAALTRLLDWYLAMVDSAADLIYPQLTRLPRQRRMPGAFVDAAYASAWLCAEQGNLVAAAGRAADPHPHPQAWHLADALRGHFWFGLRGPAWASAARAGLDAATRLGDVVGEATMLSSLGQLHWSLGEFHTALDVLERALVAQDRAGSAEGRAQVQNLMSLVFKEQGRLREATARLAQALEITRANGNRRVLPAHLGNYAHLLYEQGRFAEALDCAEQAIAIADENGNLASAAIARHTRGEVYAWMGRPDLAIPELVHSVVRLSELGHDNALTGVLEALACAHLDRGHPDQALGYAERALRKARETGNRKFEASVLATLSQVLRSLGRWREAVEHHNAALWLANQTGFQLARVRALAAIAAFERSVGEPAAALIRLRQVHERPTPPGRRGGHSRSAWTPARGWAGPRRCTCWAMRWRPPGSPARPPPAGGRRCTSTT